MGTCLWILMLMVSQVSPYRRPAEDSPCRVHQDDVDCSSLSLRRVPAPLPSSIRLLDLSQNLLQNLTLQDLPSRSSLRRLDLHHNQIQFLQPGLFRDLLHLEDLDLSGNALDLYAALHTPLGPLPALRRLDLSGNGLFTDMSDYFLSDAPALTNALHLLDAHIFSSLPSIRSLHLQQNLLSICADPQISSGCVHLSDIPSLTYLYLSENSLSSIPDGAFKGSPLLILDLSLNPGVDITAASLSGVETSLTHLSLRGNQLHSLSIDFRVFQKLRSLDVSVNRLSGVSPWSEDSSVEILNLQNNRVEALGSALLQGRLRTLYVGWNPLSCCRNPQLLDLLQQERLHVPDLAAATCWYSGDVEQVEVSVSAALPELCSSADSRVLWVSLMVALALGLALVLTVSLKLCHSRKHRFKRGFKA